VYLEGPSVLGTFPGLLPSELGRRPGKQRSGTKSDLKIEKVFFRGSLSS